MVTVNCCDDMVFIQKDRTNSSEVTHEARPQTKTTRKKELRLRYHRAETVISRSIVINSPSDPLPYDPSDLRKKYRVDGQSSLSIQAPVIKNADLDPLSERAYLKRSVFTENRRGHESGAGLGARSSDRTAGQGFGQGRLDRPKPTSLDKEPQSTTWTKKHKRTYSCALSGLKRCEYLKRDAYFLTLTSAPGQGGYLARHWDLLVKRIRRELNYKFVYMKVETSEGNGVIHALFHSAFDGWPYDAIHAYISCLWMELHKSSIVWCSVVTFVKKVASYITQYMAGQKGFVRRSCSKNWIFPGYRAKFMELIKKLGFVEALKKWDFLLKHYRPKERTRLVTLEQVCFKRIN